MVECLCVCNLLVSLLCLHYHRSWLIGYVCVCNVLCFFIVFTLSQSMVDWVCVCVMFLFLYCVYTVTELG